MPIDNAHEVPADSDFRFVVLGHPEAGEFLEWDVAVAKAWELTPPGEKRVEVTLGQKGAIRVRTEDPDPQPVQVLLAEDPDYRIHTVREFIPKSGGHSVGVQTDCDFISQGSWETYDPHSSGDEYSPCPVCQDRRNEPMSDVSAHGAKVRIGSTSLHAVVHKVERAHLRFVQLRCGVIRRRGSLVLATHATGLHCQQCFDPDADPPPRPSLWT